MNWGTARMISKPSSTTSRTSLCNSHVAQDIIKTGHRSMQLNGGLVINACSSD